MACRRVSTGRVADLRLAGFGLTGPGNTQIRRRRHTQEGPWRIISGMRSIPEPGADAPAPHHRTQKNPLSPKKLLLTKWTAVTPRNREKHFVVLRVIEPEPPSIRVEQVELEAVHSRQVYLLHWRELTDASLWRQGWV